MDIAPLNFPFVTIAALVSAVMSVVGCRYFIAHSLLQDEVTHRSSHQRSTSRGGGVSIIIGLIVGFLLSYLALPEVFYPKLLWLLGLTVLGCGLGFLDDLGKLGYISKLLGQTALGLFVAILVGPISSIPLPLLGQVELGSWGYLLTVLWIVSFINVFNFMDGLNGIAAGTSLVALIVYALLFQWAGQIGAMFACILMIASLAGFAYFNFAPGRIFMGDSGSHGLGVFVAGLVVLGSQPDIVQSPISFVVMPIIFIPFIMDVAITLWRRASVGEALYIAHKEHYYQRLHQRGISHVRVAVLYVLLAVISAIIAVIVLHLPAAQQWLGPVFLICLFSAVLSQAFSKSD